MDIPTVLFALVNCAIVVYAFDRLGAMIPDSSWGGLYVVVERMWSWRQAVPSSEGATAPFDHNAGSGPTDDAPTADPRDEPVPVIEELSGTPPRWLW
jgi:hypothetical protein